MSRKLHIIAEIWQAIPNREGYEASNLGNIRGIDRFCHCLDRWGKICEKRVRGRIINPNINRKGYNEVRLSFNGKPLTQTVHKLVMWAFGTDKGTNTQINHLNGDKLDNRYCNLEWTNNSGNQLHAYKTGLKRPRKGEDNINHKLSNEAVVTIKNMYNNGIPVSKIHEKYSYVSKVQIRNVLNGNSWSEIGDPVNYGKFDGRLLSSKINIEIARKSRFKPN